MTTCLSNKLGGSVLTLNHLKAFCFCRALKNFDPIAKEVNSAVLAINDVINYFNVRDKSLEVKPGNEVKIIIRPSKQNSTTSFAGLGLDSEKENLNFIVKKKQRVVFLFGDSKVSTSYQEPLKIYIDQPICTLTLNKATV